MKKNSLESVILKNLPEDKLIEYRILKEVGDEEKIKKFLKSTLDEIEEMFEKDPKKFLPPLGNQINDY